MWTSAEFSNESLCWRSWRYDHQIFFDGEEHFQGRALSSPFWQNCLMICTHIGLAADIQNRNEDVAIPSFDKILSRWVPTLFNCKFRATQLSLLWSILPNAFKELTHKEWARLCKVPKQILILFWIKSTRCLEIEGCGLRGEPEKNAHHLMSPSNWLVFKGLLLVRQQARFF